MHGKSRQEIKDVPDPWLIVATWDDFRSWEKSWPLILRLRWRMRFIALIFRRWSR